MLFIPDFPHQNWFGIWTAIGALVSGAVFGFSILDLPETSNSIYQLFLTSFFVVSGVPTFMLAVFALHDSPRIKAGLLGFSGFSLCILALMMESKTNSPQYLAEMTQRQEALGIAREYQGKKKVGVGVTEEWRVVYAFEEAAPNTGSGVQMLIASDTADKHRVVFFSIGGCGQTMEGKARVGRKIKVTKQVVFANDDWHPLDGKQVLYFANNCAESR